MGSMEAKIVRAFRTWCRENGVENPTGQDAAQFFTDACVREVFPTALGWPAVHAALKATKAFDRPTNEKSRRTPKGPAA